MKKSNFSYLAFLLLLIILFLPLFSLTKPGLPLTHDGLDHVVRIGSFYDSLMEGNLIPRWGRDLNLGYGHPVLSFFYPFSSYLGSLFHLTGLSLVDSTKMVFGFSLLFSGIFMYLWLKEFLGVKAGLVGALFYTFAPYRFVDLYVRGAIGECVAFVWLPLILYFGLKFSKEQKNIYLFGGSLSLGLLIMSHNLLSLMFLPLVLGYFLFLLFPSIKKRKTNPLLGFGLMVVLAFALSAFFWLPAFFEGKYTLRDIVTKDNITGLEPLGRLIWSPWSYGGTGSLSVQLGPLHWLSILVSPILLFVLKKRKDRLFYFGLFILFSFVASMFLMLPIARPFYLQFDLLQKFQFGWRFLSLALFAPVFFVAILISFLKESQRTIFLFLVIVSLLGLSYRFWQPRDYLLKPDSYYQQATFTSTNDTGESSPRWSIRRMERERKADLEVIEGEAEIKTGKRKVEFHSYEVKVREKSRLVENTLYFPNWQILANGKILPIEFQDPEFRGLMTFWLEPGEYQLEVVFKETKLRQATNCLSFFSLLSLFIVGFLPRMLERKKR